MPRARPTDPDLCAFSNIKRQVDRAPTFPEVLVQFQRFLVKHGLIDPTTGQRLVRYSWCSDGPFDVRDFVVKQCFISNVRAFNPGFPSPQHFFSPWSYSSANINSNRLQCPIGYRATSLM